jgi:hypothetical protein
MVGTFFQRPNLATLLSVRAVEEQRFLRPDRV